MLKRLRLTLALIFFAFITLLFLDFTGVIHSYFGWMAKMQLFPALGSSLFVAIGLLVLTLLFGRIYCSVLCPLGVFQDIVSRLADGKKKNRFSFIKPNILSEILRYSILGLIIISALTGFSVLITMLEPYSIFGRMVSQLLNPLYLWGNNALAFFAEKIDSYAFYNVDVWLKSAVALLVALFSFFIITIFALKTGRGYCNTICPVGSILGFFSRFSLFKPVIDKNQCVECGICAKNCKSSCIDAKQKKIDYCRCVTCFNCLEICPKGGIKYTMFKKNNNDVLNKTDNSKRNFISAAVLLLIGFFTRKIYGYDYDGGLAPIEDKKMPTRMNPIIPPGAENLRHFRKLCSGCQLCISACPNNVLRPTSSLNGFMQPQLSFERGFCRPECVRCSQVCPTGAITPITIAEKSATQIGYAVWVSDVCIINTDNVNCDLCANKCPAAAITMIASDPNNARSQRFPMIDTHRCIGCGACETLCPARPYSAIYVEGIDTHRTV